MHAVELEVEQLADAQPAGPGQQQGVGGEPELGASECLAETPVGVDGQIAGKGLGQAGHVGAEDEAPLRVRLPSPTR